MSVRCEPLSLGQTPPCLRSRSAHEVLPLGQGGRAAKLIGLSVDEVAFLGKVVVKRGMD